jgi:hypothetical protein
MRRENYSARKLRPVRVVQAGNGCLILCQSLAAPTSLRAFEHRGGGLAQLAGGGGSSTSARRGAFGNAVSTCAISTSSDLRASMCSAKRVKNFAICSGGTVRSVAAASAAAASVASQSAQVLTGYSAGSISPVAGFSARKVPVAVAARHSPAMRTGWCDVIRGAILSSRRRRCVISLHQRQHLAHGIIQPRENRAAHEAVADVQLHQMRHAEKHRQIFVI